MSPSSKYDHDRYSVSETILLLSRHVELNSGPSTVKEINSVTFPAATDLEMRLHQFGFRPLDVCGAGDCFFFFLDLCYISCMEIQAIMISLELLGYTF